MKRVVVAAIAVAAAGLVLFGAPAEGMTTYAGVMVNGVPTGFRFSKGSCTTSAGDGNFNVVVGDAVRWENCTGTNHTVTGDGFGSPEPIAGGGEITITFNSPGTFAYQCNFHPDSMKGTVTVTGEPTTTTPTTPATTATTAAATTTTTRPATTTTGDIAGVFGTESTTSTTPTTSDPTVTTRALGEGGDSGTSAGLVALLILGLGGVGTVGALLLRRLRTPAEPPTD